MKFLLGRNVYLKFKKSYKDDMTKYVTRLLGLKTFHDPK